MYIQTEISSVATILWGSLRLAPINAPAMVTSLELVQYVFWMFGVQAEVSG